MSRSVWNFTVDCALAVLFITMLATAAVVQFVFPGAADAAGWYVWGWNYETWTTIHFVILGSFALTVLLHLALHWTWVVGFVSARISNALGKRIRVGESEKTLYGVATLILVLTGLNAFLFFAHISSSRPPTEGVLQQQHSR